MPIKLKIQPVRLSGQLITRLFFMLPKILKTLRSDKIFRHKLGTPVGKVINRFINEKDETFSVSSVRNKKREIYSNQFITDTYNRNPLS